MLKGLIVGCNDAKKFGRCRFVQKVFSFSEFRVFGTQLSQVCNSRRIQMKRTCVLGRRVRTDPKLVQRRRVTLQSRCGRCTDVVPVICVASTAHSRVVKCCTGLACWAMSDGNDASHNCSTQRSLDIHVKS